MQPTSQQPNSQKSANPVMQHGGTTRKGNLQKKFVRKMKSMKKRFVPVKLREQNDPLYAKLKEHHDSLHRCLSNMTTEKISGEVEQVVQDTALMDDCSRLFQWTKDEENRLNELNTTCKLLEPRQQWTWGASDDTVQGQYNDERMKFCLTEECSWKLIECPQCQSTGLLVGIEQVESTYCYDCVLENEKNQKARQKLTEAWEQVRPVSKEYPKRTESGHEDENLPYLECGDRAVISPIHPVVTVKKNHYANKKLRLESISLVQDPVPTWSKILPRTSLADRFLIIERRARDSSKRYIVANTDRVRQWLLYLFEKHPEFMKLSRNNELSLIHI